MAGIVSLLPSATEWVYALGLDGELAGVTFECDHPTEARTRHPVVVEGLDTTDLTPREIDTRVRERIANGERLYTLDTDAMARIAPDVVLTQDLCEVCALPSSAVDAALEAVGRPSQVVTMDPHRLDGVLDGAVQLAEVAGVPERGHQLRAELRGRLDQVASALRERPRPQVLVLEWTAPPFLSGHWVPDMIDAAGGVPLLASGGERSVSTDWDTVASVQPDVTLVAPCGLDLNDARKEAYAVLDRLPHGSAVWAVDAGGYVTRPGPRVVDAVEALAHMLHPDVAPPRIPTLVERVR